MREYLDLIALSLSIALNFFLVRSLYVLALRAQNGMLAKRPSELDRKDKATSADAMITAGHTANPDYEEID